MLEDVLQFLPRQPDCEAENRHGIGRLAMKSASDFSIDFRQDGKRAGHRPNLLAIRSWYRGVEGSAQLREGVQVVVERRNRHLPMKRYSTALRRWAVECVPKW